jgi:hypothetical protein
LGQVVLGRTWWILRSEITCQQQKFLESTGNIRQGYSPEYFMVSDGYQMGIR